MLGATETAGQHAAWLQQPGTNSAGLTLCCSPADAICLQSLAAGCDSAEVLHVHCCRQAMLHCIFVQKALPSRSCQVLCHHAHTSVPHSALNSPTLTQHSEIPYGPRTTSSLHVRISFACVQRQLELGVAWPTPGSKFWEQAPRATPMPVDVGAGSNMVQPRDSRSLDVVHFTAELAPIAKVGAASVPVEACGLRSCPWHNHTMLLAIKQQRPCVPGYWKCTCLMS